MGRTQMCLSKAMKLCDSSSIILQSLFTQINGFASTHCFGRCYCSLLLLLTDFEFIN